MIIGWASLGLGAITTVVATVAIVGLVALGVKALSSGGGTRVDETGVELAPARPPASPGTRAWPCPDRQCSTALPDHPPVLLTRNQAERGQPGRPGGGDHRVIGTRRRSRRGTSTGMTSSSAPCSTVIGTSVVFPVRASAAA
jgi:hypothetical protein